MNYEIDAQSVSRVFQTHYGLIISVASRYVPSPDLVYDVVHQTFIDFLNAAMREDWNPEKDPRPYLHAIVKNLAIDLWRQEKKRTPASKQKIAEILMSHQRHREEENALLNDLQEKNRTKESFLSY